MAIRSIRPQDWVDAMNRRDLFRFARKGYLFVPESANSPDIISADCKTRGRAQVGYSRRFFMGAMAAGVVSASAARLYAGRSELLAGGTTIRHFYLNAETEDVTLESVIRWPDTALSKITRERAAFIAKTETNRIMHPMWNPYQNWHKNMPPIPGIKFSLPSEIS
jgi:hypothetical protein